MRHRVHVQMNHPFHGLPASMVPTAGTSPAASPQHRGSVAEATHQWVPMSEGLQRCGLLGAGERRTCRGASLRVEQHLCRQGQVAGHRGASHVSARTPLFAAGGWYKGPRFSRLREDRMIFTSSLAAFAHLWGTCPPRLSHSTWGSGMGSGGWLGSHDGPLLSPGLGSETVRPQTPPAGSAGTQRRRAPNTHAGFPGGHVEQELGGLTSPKVPQHQQSRCYCSPALGPSFSSGLTYPLALLPSCPVCRRTDQEHLSAGESFPCQGKLLI